MQKPYKKSGGQSILSDKDAMGNNSKFQEVKYVPEQKTVARKYEDISYHQNDLSQLVNQLAVYSEKLGEIFKLSAIDYRGMRFELNGSRKSKWVRFQDAVLFNFCNEQEFDYYFQKFLDAKVKAGAKRVVGQTEMFSWLAQDSNRLGAAIPVGIEEDEGQEIKKVEESFIEKLNIKKVNGTKDY